MKALCFADIHIGNTAYGHLVPEIGLNSRIVQGLEILRQIVDYACDESNGIDMVLFAGDMYKNQSPATTVVDYINRQLIRLSNKKIPTIILDGNHDVSSMEVYSSGLAQYKTLQVPYIIQDRFYAEHIITTKDGKKYQIVMLPTYHEAADIKHYMEQIKTTYDTIVVGHLAVRNAMLNDWTVADRETMIDLNDLTCNPKIRAVVLGHFHKYQCLHQQNPIVYYCGSADRIDFSEEKQLKGFVVLEVNDSETVITHHALKTQKMYTLNIDIQDSEGEDITPIVIKALQNHKNDIADAILRIRVYMLEGILNERQVIQQAMELGAQYVLRVQKMLPVTKTAAIVPQDNIDNTMSVQNAIAQYFEGATRAKERSALAVEIVREVENDVPKTN